MVVRFGGGRSLSHQLQLLKCQRVETVFLHRQVTGVQDLRTLRHVRLAAAEIPRVTQVPLLQVTMETTK